MFADRTDAAEKLADKLARYKDTDAVVLALPRGGVVLGKVLAERLGLPLGLVMVKKIGHPHSPEYAIGAIAEDGRPVLNEREAVSVNASWLDKAVKDARNLIEQRRQTYYDGFQPPDVKEKTAILVDDGIATGLTMKAAVDSLKSQGVEKIVVAVPVASADSLEYFKTAADETVVLEPPKNFLGAVGSHYGKFEQVGDAEVTAMLKGTAAP